MSEQPVIPRAQADQALQDAAVALKRSLGVTRRALQSVRQAQVNLLGVPVDTHTAHEEGIVDDPSPNGHPAQDQDQDLARR